MSYLRGWSRRMDLISTQTNGSRNSRGLAFETNLRIGGGLRSLYLAGQLKFQDPRNHDDGLGPAAVFEQGKSQRFGTINK
jgi:hypothetical protein